MCRARVCRQPSTHEKVDMQPLVCNFHAHEVESHQLGERKHIDLAIWGSGVLSYLASNFSHELHCHLEIVLLLFMLVLSGSLKRSIKKNKKQNKNQKLYSSC